MYSQWFAVLLLNVLLPFLLEFKAAVVFRANIILGSQLASLRALQLSDAFTATAAAYKLSSERVYTTIVSDVVSQHYHLLAENNSNISDLTFDGFHTLTMTSVGFRSSPSKVRRRISFTPAAYLA